MEASNSPAFKLNTTDLWKIARGALVVAVGTFLTTSIEGLQGLDLGVVGNMIMVSLASSLIEAIRRYVTDYSKVQ